MMQNPVSPSAPIKMPLTRRRQSLMRISSSPVANVDAQGTAFLCFPEDHSWFQGNISTDDESNYSLYGELVVASAEEKAAAATRMAESVKKMSLTESDEENNNGGDDQQIGDNDKSDSVGGESYYKVTMIDHFSGLKHRLPRIYPTRDLKAFAKGLMFTSKENEFTFEAEQVYKGQRAEMMIQRYLGSPIKLGTKCLLYSGQINIMYDECIEACTSWCM